MLPPDTIIIQGLKGNDRESHKYQEILYKEYEYLIVHEGCHKYRLTYDDSFSAYQDAFRSFVDNITNERFDGHSSLKTYFSKIFFNKCIDQGRKNATNKNEVHKAAPLPDLIDQLPDSAKTIIEGLMTRELKEEVKAQMEAIGEKCKQILLLYEDGLTDKEIAEQLSYNNAAVAKTTRLRCLDKLREKMLGK